MPIKYNNFDIGNAYLGNDNLVAMYQGSNLVWTNGIKLTSLLGKQNVETLKDSGGFYKCHTDNTWKENYNSEETSKITTLNTTHKYCCIIHSTDVSNAEYEYGNIAYKESEFAWASVSNVGLYRDNGYISVSFNCSDERVRFGYMGNVGATIYSQVVIDLTKAKLDSLSAEQVYNLLTLNGTDFTDLELLANGNKVSLKLFKQQTTNSVDLGSLTWIKDTSGYYCNDAPKDIKPSGVCSCSLYEYSATTWTNGCCGINYLGYIWVADTQYSDENAFKNAMSGVKLTYELSSSNNIGGSKYGFVKLKDLDWYAMDMTSHRFYAYNLQYIIKKPSSVSIPNAFFEKYKTRIASGTWDNSIDKSFVVGSDGFVGIVDTNYDSATALKQALTDNDILVYELANSLGNKLDNYSAEQVYYMFFATLGNQKMYVPKGVEFESSDNIILGTKYGIVDLGDVDWYVFQSGDNWCATSNFINNKTKVYGGSEIPNIYINGYSANGYWYSINDKEVRIDTEGHDLYIWDSVFIEMSNEQVKTYLKGKYLIYELATPNGTNYNDLTVKQMYDLINDNAIELLANGKTIGGITNLLGKQNIPLTIDGSTRNIICPIQSGGFDYWNASQNKGISVIKDHKYFVCFYGNFQNSVPDSIIIQDKNNDYSTLAEIYQVVSKDGSWYFDFKKSYGGSFISSVSTNGAVVENRYWSGWNQFFTDGDIIEGLIVIDLTINNLQDKTDREVYTMLKEKHLFDLTTSGEIKLGGI